MVNRSSYENEQAVTTTTTTTREMKGSFLDMMVYPFIMETLLSI